MSPTPRPLIIFGLVLLALGVRFLTWQDNRRDIGKVQTSVTEGYKDSARQLANGDFKLFASDINHMGHPPGYPILLAAIFKTVGESDTAIQFVQILLDTVSVVLVFLIALKLLPFAAATICGVLAAISPQFAYFSVVLLPDSLVVPPILLAIWFLIPIRKEPRLARFAIAGALIGLSCWFRANALFLPVFLALLTPLFVARGKRLPAAAALIAGALLMIAPVTIKNAIVFRSFIPLSLGAGQTFLEGIADYDEANRFNIPNTDLGLMRQEAEWYGNPEYARLLFGRDGVARDRMRIERGLAVVGSHPFWFAGVVAKRGLASTRLDPVPVLHPESPISHPVPSFSATEQLFPLETQPDKYAVLHISEPMAVKTATDYAACLPVKLEQGRLQIKITDERTILASTNVDLVEGVPPAEQPVHNLNIPFVSANHSQVRLVIENFAARDSSALVGTSRLIELGPSSYQWLRHIRVPLGYAQQLFKTAWILPLTLVGLFIMVRKRDWQSLAILLAVPAYYLVVQSTLHTERRYVYIIHFFFLIFASDALCKIATRVFLVLSSSFSLFGQRQPKG
ncbi:MAG TPA: glycosyltransferase family 39 protein [Pyrinomonadaceae bacterium]|nr:glycosyltransferase family 39 protein [Pyrinomonadaceae bacterium]